MSTFVTAALMTSVARSHSLRDSAAIIARRILGRNSTSSYQHRRRALVIHTRYASTSSTMSCMRRSSPTMSNDGASRETAVAGVRSLRSRNRQRCKWMWMIGEARPTRISRMRCYRARCCPRVVRLRSDVRDVQDMLGLCV